MDTAELKGAVEALVFASEAPVRAERLAEILEAPKARVLEILRELAAEYENRGGGMVLAGVAEGYQFRTSPKFADVIRRLGRSRSVRFSRAALETLAIIAYRQPITRAEIEYLRGVDSGGVVKTLLDRRLIRILGKEGYSRSADDLRNHPGIPGSFRPAEPYRTAHPQRVQRAVAGG